MPEGFEVGAGSRQSRQLFVEYELVSEQRPDLGGGGAAKHEARSENSPRRGERSSVTVLEGLKF